MFRFWKKQPRIEWLKAAQMGYKPKEDTNQKAELYQLAAQMGVSPGTTQIG
jgi:hypothetical protein